MPTCWPLSEALLQPVDVLFFRGGWHHHTESVGVDCRDTEITLSTVETLRLH